MGKIKELFLKYKQFLLFCIVGVSNTLIANLIYFLLVKIFEYVGISISIFDFDITSAICTAIGTVFGAINSYILNSKFVFEEKNKSTGSRFIIAFFIYMILDMLLVMFVEKVVGVPSDYCKLIVTPIMLIENFLINKLWVFKSDKKTE